MSRLALSLLAALLALPVTLLPAYASSGNTSRYIVVLKDSVDDPGSVAKEHSRDHGARVGHVYRHALKGYSASMSDVAAARLANDARVSYVEPDGVVHKSSLTQEGATWGLDRIDERERDGVSTYTYDTAGASVRVYIIDTGVSHHSDFGSSASTDRVVGGYDVVDKDEDASDCDGHGTHVAGTVGGTLYGVAKSVTLVPVRVLDCSGSGTWSGVIEGVDWVTAQHGSGELSVANMSLGGGASSSVDDAVAGSIADGVTYAVAAGNGNSGGKAQDACGYSPARVPTALTVGATNNTDTKASWSNYGTCLDLFAPGVSITSTTMDGGTATWSGTSMATPHVAGVAALYLSEFGASSPATVATAITGQATAGVVSSAGSGSPEKLLYSLLDAATTGTGDGGGSGGDDGGTTGTVTMSDSITQSMTSGKGGKSELQVTVTVVSAVDGSAVSGAGVSVSIVSNDGRSWSGSGTTSSAGTVTFKLGNIRSGCYTSTVTNVSPPSSAYVWDGTGDVSDPLCK